MRKSFLTTTLVATAFLSACAQPGQNLQANVYQAGQVNQRQDAKVVQILAVLPARIEVNNEQNQKTAQVAGLLLGVLGGAFLGGGLSHHGGGALLGGVGGGIAGSAAGSLVPGSALVDGVSLTYNEDGRTFHSAQVGRICEFHPGDAIVISTTAGETRVQPNAPCPPTT